MSTKDGQGSEEPGVLNACVHRHQMTQINAIMHCVGISDEGLDWTSMKMTFRNVNLCFCQLEIFNQTFSAH